MGTLNHHVLCRFIDGRERARMGRATRAAGKGFTLLELMVVVGVMATMLALLLPALNRVRESARRTTDLSNLRQLTAACLLYAQENDGALPRGRQARAGADDYTWLNYSTCWNQLSSILPQIDLMNACASVREGYEDPSEFGKPLAFRGWPNDVRVGWIYWGGRDNLVDPKTGLPTYRSLRRVGQRSTPGSPTLWTCWSWDSNNSQNSNSVCPHVGTHYIEYAPGVVLQSREASVGARPPDGLAVALIDGSASFVPWEELAIVQQGNGFKLYYQP
jgi:prepilin-type N-terminal cleavage/methylation domain-containing protein